MSIREPLEICLECGIVRYVKSPCRACEAFELVKALGAKK